MTWRYILKQFGLPPGSLILILCMSWWLRKRWPRTAAVLFFSGLLSFYLLSLPLSVEWFARQLETEPAVTPEQWRTVGLEAQAIVVLGGGREMADAAWGADQPSLFSQQRLRYAARIARATGLPLLVSGGLHFGQPPSEAEIAATSLALDFDTPATWLEEHSRTTWENAAYSAQILQPLGINSIILVTDAWHSPRSRWSFEQHGFKVQSAPMGFWGVPNRRPVMGLLPESKAFWQNNLLLNEWLGSRWYRWFYTPNP